MFFLSCHILMPYFASIVSRVLHLIPCTMPYNMSIACCLQLHVTYGDLYYFTEYYLSLQGMRTQCWCNAGPLSATVAQHYPSIGSIPLVFSSLVWLLLDTWSLYYRISCLDCRAGLSTHEGPCTIVCASALWFVFVNRPGNPAWTTEVPRGLRSPARTTEVLRGPSSPRRPREVPHGSQKARIDTGGPHRHRSVWYLITGSLPVWICLI